MPNYFDVRCISTNNVKRQVLLTTGVVGRGHEVLAAQADRKGCCVVPVLLDLLAVSRGSWSQWLALSQRVALDVAPN
jgi:hypothetical protein